MAGTTGGMSDNSELRDDDQADEAVQAVVDRVLSWQAGAPEETVKEELESGLREIGADMPTGCRARRSGSVTQTPPRRSRERPVHA